MYPPISYPVPFLSLLSFTPTHAHSNLLSARVQKGMVLDIRVVRLVTVDLYSGCTNELEPKSGSDWPPVPGSQASGHPALGTGMSC